MLWHGKYKDQYAYHKDDYTSIDDAKTFCVLLRHFMLQS